MNIEELLNRNLNYDKLIKQRLCYFYNRDANDFYNRSKVLLTVDDVGFTDSYKSKIYIDLRFSLECSLKATIIALSEDTENIQKVYNKVRNYGHKIEQMTNQIQAFTNNTFFESPELNEIKSLTKLTVDSRYWFDYNMAKRKDTTKARFFELDTLNSFDYNKLISLLRLCAKIITKSNETIEKTYPDAIILVGEYQNKMFEQLLDEFNNKTPSKKKE